MHRPHFPPNESGRLLALRRYAVLDTPPEQGLDDLAALAAQICDTPIALVSLVDEHRQWFKARVGLQISETARDISFCGHALGQSDLFVVPDTLKDERFADNPLVTGEPHMRSYVGAPLVTPDGDVLGTLCVIDRVPRHLTPAQANALRILGRQAMTQLELGRQARELGASEAKLRAILDAEPECVKLISDEGVLFEMNAAGLRLLEADRLDGLIGRSLLPLVVAEDRDRIAATLRAVASGERRTAQYRIVGLKGTLRPLEMVALPFRDVASGRNLVLAVSHDITARNLAEDRIQRLNRLYAVSSAVNEAIVRIADTDRLYEEACRIAVERGGFSMAWVGLVDADEHVLRPVANCGRNDGYLESITVSVVADRPDGRGPAGRAFRSGAPAWSNDIEADAAMFASYREAFDRGYRSCACFPLVLEGRPVGVLAVYSDETDVFQSEAIQLLTALTENISFAIDAHGKERHRLRAEMETRDLAERLTTTLESLTEGFFTLDLEWRFTYVNAQGERLLQRPRAELIGRHIWDAFPEARDTVSDHEYERAVRDNVAVEFETYYPPLSRWFGSRAYPSSQGLAVYFQDTTEQRRAIDALRVSEERFRLLSKATNDAIWDWNLITDEIWWNEGFEVLFGYARDEVGRTSESWTSRIHPDARDLVVTDVWRAIEGSDETWQSEYRFRRRDGTYADVLDRGYLIREADGRAIRMIGGMTDVTERKRLEQQFLRAQRMESIGTLAGGIAHDLNNALTPILMAIGMLKSANTDPGNQQLLTIIESSAMHGADLVRQVLSFARGVEGRRIEVDVRPLIRDIEKLANETFLKTIQIRVRMADDLWMMTGDPTQIHQVVMNLCVNARDAMPAGGQLTLSAENLTVDAHFAAFVPDAVPGPYVVIAVQDTGVGIPLEIADKIFDPFFTTKEPGKGTGLGLATSLAIVRSHGGFIRPYSEVGRGTTFRVYLPAQTVRSAAASGPAVAELPRGNGELVLVVDDEKSVRQVTQQMLTAFGYRVMLAADGADAVAVFAKHRGEVAVVVTDMMMPVMDGPAMAQVLRRMDPHVPIIAASGLTTSHQTAQVVRLGVKHVLPKPFTADVLLKALRDVLHPK